MPVELFGFGGELVLFILEQEVESGERTVAAGDVLLEFDLFGIGENGMGIDLLLHYAQLVADTDDLVEKNLERDLFGLERGVRRVKDDFAAVPARGELFHHAVRLFQS